jgi:hypothetical protein
LNIDRLHVEKKIERLGNQCFADARCRKRGYYDWIASARIQDDRNVMLAVLARRRSLVTAWVSGLATPPQ